MGTCKLVKTRDQYKISGQTKDNRFLRMNVELGDKEKAAALLLVDGRLRGKPERTGSLEQLNGELCHLGRHGIRRLGDHRYRRC